MKSVDPGILPQSECFTFQPSDFAKEALMYVTWCGHYFCTDQYYMKRDTYPYLLMIFVRRGKMDVRYHGVSHVAEKGDVILMDCMHPHYYHAQNDLEFVYLHFDGGSSHAIVNYLVDNNNNSPIFRQKNNIEIGKMLYDRVQLCGRNSVRNALHDSYWIDTLLHKLSVETIPQIQEDSPIDLAICYIREHVGEPISLDDLARLTNFSSCYLSHAFKKQTGYSPSEYVINTRLERAQILLTYSHKLVNEIAFDVGYNSASSFTNVFIRKIGCTPKEYRKMQRGQVDLKQVNIK